MDRVQAVEKVDVVVSQHRPQYLTGLLRTLRVHVAPPKHGFYAANQAHAPMVAKHASELCIDTAFYTVVRRR